MVRKIPATDALSELGYQLVAGRTYRATWSNSEVEHFIYLEGFRSGAPPAAWFGLRNADAEQFAAKCVGRHGWSFIETVVDRRGKSDCLMRFSFGRFDAFWNRGLRRLDEPAFASAVKGIAEHRLLSSIREVTSKEKLFDVLTCDDEPFPWFATNGAIRAAIIVAIGAQAGIPALELRTQLRSKASFISAGLSKHSPFFQAPDDYIERVQQDWTLGPM